MKSSPLEALPIELVELIVTFLEPRDVASLRLTSRIVADKTSQGSFAARFTRRTVALTTATLREMVRVTGQGHLGRLLQHVTIAGIARDGTTAAEKEEEEEDTEHRRLLTEAFDTLKRRSPTGGLSSLRLRVAARVDGADGEELVEPDHFYAWRRVWDAALRAFKVTMAALSEARLPVTEQLDLFGSVRGCSLACDAFLLAFAHGPASMMMRTIFGSVKRVMVSLSAPYQAATEHGSESESRHANLILQNILQVLLPVMPELQSLDLHWYNLGASTSTSPVPSATRQDSNSNTSSAAAANLKECSLRGIYVSEDDLLRFLQAVRPATVTLTDIRLVAGTYASIFHYLTDPDGPVTRYHLDDIRERNALVHFDVPGRPKFRYCRDDAVGPSSLTRRASQEVKEEEGIRYRFARGRALGAGERRRWLQSKAREFGPPRSGVYDFIQMNSQQVAAASEGSDDE
ncbi:hypothetical protein VTN02DRAFT_4710 [Thermoascus thermophilus]